MHQNSLLGNLGDFVSHVPNGSVVFNRFSIFFFLCALVLRLLSPVICISVPFFPRLSPLSPPFYPLSLVSPSSCVFLCFFCFSLSLFLLSSLVCLCLENLVLLIGCREMETETATNGAARTVQHVVPAP